MSELLPLDYQTYLAQLKERIRSAQVKAALAVNRELVLLYWGIGRDILQRQAQQGWGTKVIDQLARDLKQEFPEMSGFSSRNLKYMRAFADAYPAELVVQQSAGQLSGEPIVQQAAAQITGQPIVQGVLAQITGQPIVQGVLAQITWYHNIALLEKLGKLEERLWYAQQTIENGWSRNVLVHQIESNLYARQGKALTNFNLALPPTQSDLAQQLLKDSYVFDFLSLGQESKERDLERGLLLHLQRFMLELGKGFAFVGNQYHLDVGGQDFYIDLLFYHLKLRCYVVIDLKMGNFQPEYAGKMGFYLAAVDDLLRHPEDRQSIGLILCKSSNDVIVEYSLRDMSKAMGVSNYQILEALPTVAQLEAELKRVPETEAGNDREHGDNS
jgi:predicted nuclease of restriction endonuclease-like (RecB) superfamily